MEELKKMMGFPPTDTVDSIREQFNGDMEKYAKTYPQEVRFYRQTLERQYTVLQEKDESLANEQATVKDLKAQLVSVNAVMDKKINEFQASAKAAQDDKQGEISKFNATATRLRLNWLKWTTP